MYTLYVNHVEKINSFCLSPQVKTKPYEPLGTMRLFLRTVLL
jgi:hypothetical protein